MPLKIKVPYNEKDIAKSKGAFWDVESKTWYIPDHKNYNDFLKWIENDEFKIIAKAPFFLALNKRDCWKCSKITDVISLASNNFYKLSDDGNLKRIWVRQDYLTFFSKPTFIDKNILSIIQEKYPFFKLGYSNTIKGRYFANHCKYCNTLLGDFYNHTKSGGPFCPIDIEGYEKIVMMKFPSKFDLRIRADFSISSNADEIFEYSKREEW